MHTISPHLSSLVAQIDGLSRMREVRVFGSLLTRPEEAKDVDLGVMIDEPFSSQRLQAFLPLLRHGAYGTPHYGLLDVFVVFTDSVWVRDDNARGFVPAKKPQTFRKAIAAGTPWKTWRPTVLLDATILPCPTPRRRAYFAHPISTYASDEEAQAIATLHRAGFQVINPSDPEHAHACGSDMERWAALAGSCDAIAFLPFADGAVGAGVVKEVDTVHGMGKPVFQLPPDGTRLDAVGAWPGELALLDVPATRERLRAFRETRAAAGLPLVPTRPSPVRSTFKP